MGKSFFNGGYPRSWLLKNIRVEKWWNSTFQAFKIRNFGFSGGLAKCCCCTTVFVGENLSDLTGYTCETWLSLIQLDSPAADWHVEAVTRTMRSMMVNVYTCEMVNPSIISIANRPPSFSRSAPTTPSWSNRSQDAVPVSGGRSADLRDRCAIVFSHRLVGLLAGECWDRTNNHFKSPS